MLREFFVNEHPHFLFKPFGLIHNIFTFLAFFTALMIYLNRNKISQIPEKKSRFFLKICSIILLLNMLIYTFGNLYYGSFDYHDMLPFHLCFIANYMFMFAILFHKDSLLKLTLFISFIGPIPAILWPDLVSTIDNFNFWQLIISHHFFMNISFFSYYALNYKITWEDFNHVFILLNFFLLLVYPINRIFNTNYIFTNYIPENVIALYPWLKYLPTLLILEVVGLTIAYLIYRIIIVPRNKELS